MSWRRANRHFKYRRLILTPGVQIRRVTNIWGKPLLGAKCIFKWFIGTLSTHSFPDYFVSSNQSLIVLLLSRSLNNITFNGESLFSSVISDFHNAPRQTFRLSFVTFNLCVNSRFRNFFGFTLALLAQFEEARSFSKQYSFSFSYSIVNGIMEADVNNRMESSIYIYT